MQTEEFSEYAKFRNGVEAISSLLRRRYHVDKQYIKDTFKCIADCDMCGLCTVFKGKDPELAHEDYIPGKREYMDVSGDYK